MLNQVIIVGRVTREIEVRLIEGQKKVCELHLAVQREYKNYDGNYDVDFIKVILWDNLADIVSSFCKKGTMVAVKGRLQIRKTEVGDIKLNLMELIGMRVVYLSPRKLELEENGDSLAEVENSVDE
jgi:single-strand DNA-binding protein